MWKWWSKSADAINKSTFPNLKFSMADNSGKLQKKRSNKVTASFASSSSPVAVSMGKKAIRKTSQVAPLLPTVEASSWGLDEGT